MDHRDQKRQDEYHHDLGVNGLLDLLFRKSHFAHDGKTLTVLIALNDLAEIHVEDRDGQESRTQEQSQEEQSAVKTGDRFDHIHL